MGMANISRCRELRDKLLRCGGSISEDAFVTVIIGDLGPQWCSTRAILRAHGKISEAALCAEIHAEQQDMDLQEERHKRKASVPEFAFHTQRRYNNNNYRHQPKPVPLFCHLCKTSGHPRTHCPNRLLCPSSSQVASTQANPTSQVQASTTSTGQPAQGTRNIVSCMAWLTDSCITESPPQYSPEEQLDNSTPRRESLQPNPTYAAIAQSKPSGKDTWFLDMCSSGRFVQRENELQREVVITVANNQNLRTRRQGVVQLQSRETNVILQMSKVLIAEGLGYNLLSVSQLMAKGIHLEANSTTQEFKLYHGKGGLYIGKAVLKNNVFVLDFVPDLGTADSDGIVTFTSWTHPPDLDPNFSPEGFWYSHTIPEVERTRALATIQHSAAAEPTPAAAETTPEAAETTSAAAETTSVAAETTAAATATSTPIAGPSTASAPIDDTPPTPAQQLNSTPREYRPPSARAGRFSQRAQWGLHLGIERNYNAWKIFDVHSKETVAAHDVILYERLTLPTYLASLEEDRDPTGGFRGDRHYASAADEADWDEQNVDEASEEAGPLPYCSVDVPIDDENPRESANADVFYHFADNGYVTRAEVNTNEAKRIGPNFIPDPEAGDKAAYPADTTLPYYTQSGLQILGLVTAVHGTEIPKEPATVQQALGGKHREK
ncbi:unnamed protein product [Closterium sp. NIES-53]